MPNRKASTHRPMPTHLAQTLASEIRLARERLNLTQSTLASTAGVSVQLVRRLEAGTANPTLGTVHAIARALDTELVQLLGSVRNH